MKLKKEKDQEKRKLIGDFTVTLKIHSDILHELDDCQTYIHRPLTNLDATEQEFLDYLEDFDEYEGLDDISKIFRLLWHLEEIDTYNVDDIEFTLRKE